MTVASPSWLSSRHGNRARYSARTACAPRAVCREGRLLSDLAFAARRPHHHESVGSSVTQMAVASGVPSLLPAMGLESRKVLILRTVCIKSKFLFTLGRSRLQAPAEPGDIAATIPSSDCPLGTSRGSRLGASPTPALINFPAEMAHKSIFVAS